MPAREIDDPKHWHDRAAEMRGLSEVMQDNETKLIMLRLADDYDKLGDRAAVRAASDPPASLKRTTKKRKSTWP